MIYLNNAATSHPKPIEVIEEINKYIKSVPFHSSRTGLDFQQIDIIQTCRENIRNFFNIGSINNIIFTSGATESLNLAINGLDLSNKHVISTTTEHNSVIRPLKHLEKDGEIELTFIHSDKYGYVDTEKIKNCIKENTKVIIINHCSNVTGSIQDIDSISKIAKNNNIILIVDASQSAGIIPIDVKKLNIDLLAVTGHKSLYGLAGIGFLYISDKINLKALKYGGTGIKSSLLYQPEERPLYYEAGTLNLAGIVSLNAGISFIQKTGIKKIENKKISHINRIINEIKNLKNIKIYCNIDNQNRIPILSFNIKNINPNEIGYILESSFNIISRSGLHCAPLIHKDIGSYPEGNVRISPSYFTKDDEIDIFIDAIIKIHSQLNSAK